MFDLKNSTNNLGLFKLTNRMAKTSGIRVTLDHVEPQDHWDDWKILGSQTEVSVSVNTEDEVSLDHVEDADSASLHHDNSPEPDHGDVWIDWNKLIDEELRNSISDTMSIRVDELGLKCTN